MSQLYGIIEDLTCPASQTFADREWPKVNETYGNVTSSATVTIPKKLLVNYRAPGCR